jgi:hypothetical protein
MYEVHYDLSRQREIRHTSEKGAFWKGRKKKE